MSNDTAIFEQSSTVEAAADALNAHRIAAWEHFGGDAECISTTSERLENGEFKITTRYRSHAGSK